MVQAAQNGTRSHRLRRELPPGADIFDAHTHLGITYKDIPEHDVYYLTYVMDSTPLRAISCIGRESSERRPA